MKTLNYVSPEQACAMLAFTQASPLPSAPRDAALIALLYATGVSLAEIALLQVGDIFTAEGQVKEVALIERGVDDEKISKTLYLFKPELRQLLIDYGASRLRDYPNAKVFGHGKSSKAKLFVDDKGQPFTAVRTNSTSTKKIYHSYQALSNLIRMIHQRAGVAGGNAESARRSWSMWLFHGLDGQPPVHPEWLRELRGDARLSNTLAAVGYKAPAKPDPMGTQLAQFMRSRDAA